MKRLIKFWGSYSDKCEFSSCSTKYDVLPMLVDDDAGDAELMEIALSNGIEFERAETVEAKQWAHGIKLTHALRLKERMKQDTGVFLPGNTEQRVVWLGFVSVPEGCLQPKDTLDNPIPSDKAFEIVNSQEYGINNVVTIDGEVTLVREGWDSYHALAFAGYSFESLQKHYGFTTATFSDEVIDCSECGEYFYGTDGYNYTYRVVNCDVLGIKCGCFDAWTKTNYIQKANKPKECIELETAQALEKESKLKFVERFIGGMTDGRGGYYDGESVREGNPETVLKELLSKHPKRKYLFTHDESGQFQTYFSVWQVLRGVK